jgi:hypothetical protein
MRRPKTFRKAERPPKAALVPPTRTIYFAAQNALIHNAALTVNLSKTHLSKTHS